jgi:pimeloyl-ACP methyl ester carboxylesterase
MASSRERNPFGSFAPVIRAAAAVAPLTTAGWLAGKFLSPPRPRSREDEAAVLRRAASGVARGGGREIATYFWGDGGPRAFLVHGWGGSAAQLTRFVEPLRRRGFDVVAFDAPAHGASSGRSTNVSEMADVLGELLASGEGDGEQVVVAHSLGAAATAIAIARGARAERVAMVAPAPGARAFADAAASALDLGAAARAHFFAALEAEANVSLDALEIEHVGSAVRCPVLVAHDAQDPVVRPRQLRRVLAELRPAETIETRGLGHQRILRDDAVIADVTSFLAKGGAALRTARAVPGGHGAEARVA